jgi:putative membrane protein
VRDSAANCLPFSQMGGFVLGARAVTLHGIAWPLATASTVVDVTAEFLAQLGFAAIGLAILLVRSPGHYLAAPLVVGLVLALAAGVAFIWLQQGAAPIFAKLGKRIAGDRFAGAQTQVDLLQTELAQLYTRPGHLALGCAIHLIGWLGTGIGGWIAFRLVGADIDLPAALAIEALLHVGLAAAFLVPGNIGVQEVFYIALGTIFGVPAELSLAVSLIRRARDLALGIPVLLVWQWVEVRRLRASR